MKKCSLNSGKYNSIILLGPTAVGKTAIGVRIADYFDLEIISADSRQTYRGLDLGSGKDLAEYNFEGRSVTYYMIDIADLSQEYNVFNYQSDFYKLFTSFKNTGKIPLVVGGTGMYLDSVIREYNLVPVPENIQLRKELEGKTLKELGELLLSLKNDIHNRSDLAIRERVVRAIEIAIYMKEHEDEIKENKRPDIKPFILGTTLDRDLMRQNIRKRLRERFDAGMIDEVSSLHQNGVSWDRLDRLGLEYRFIAEYLQGKIASFDELFENLYFAICHFAKRQETWFRGMERKGVAINWLSKNIDVEVRFKEAVDKITGSF